MARTSKQLTVSFLVTFGLAGCGQPAFAGQEAPLTITLHVRDDARVPRSVLIRAETEAARIYRALGVDLVWTGVTAPSAPPQHDMATNLDLAICIRSGFVVEGQSASAFVMGIAPGSAMGGLLAYVYYGRVVRVARAQWDTGAILGHVIAHELGHLLLPQNSHSREGIMRANWDTPQLLRAVSGLLQFTPEQGELIRRRVSSVRAPSSETSTRNAELRSDPGATPSAPEEIH